jgi:hypothetical protein
MGGPTSPDFGLFGLAGQAGALKFGGPVVIGRASPKDCARPGPPNQIWYPGFEDIF